MMKNKKTKKVKAVVALVLVLSLLCINAVSLSASAYGADIGSWSSSVVCIRNVNSGKYIDVPSGTVSNGKAVQLYEGNGTSAQKWDVCSEGNNYYSIRSTINTQYLLSVQGDKDVNGVSIVLKYVPTGSAVPNSALFRLSGLRSLGVTYLQPKLSVLASNRRVIDCQQAGTANGTRLLYYNAHTDFDSAAHQLWVLEDTERSPKIQNWDLVDSGGHCDWDGTTKYMSMFYKAKDTWNSYMGTERFRPDAWNRIEDIKISDAVKYTSDPSVCGTTSSNGKIVFYTKTMDGLSTNLERQCIVMHELGHALGLDHSPVKDDGSTIWNENRGNIMNPYVKAYGYQLSLDDKASYQQASKNY